MTTVFIGGSITIRHLDAKVQDRIMNIVHQKFDVIVGDADGADASIQQFLADQRYQHVTVFCTGNVPRNNIGQWAIHQVKSYHSPGSRAYFTAKDLAMAEAADSGLMIWDAKSTGTLSNVIELLSRKKYSLAFVDKLKSFHAIKSVEALEQLLDYMPSPDRRKADVKIGLSEKVGVLRSREQQLSLLAERPAIIVHH
ncbi:hypothetical protein HBH1_01956 [Herbaspirillum sp. BH-1]|uniref:Uncharacterized protein n=1 Tax=Herbaspirillum frisingense TaxID=92645 RepID=A0ABU1PEN4_9BURK|nr:MULTISPECIES: hypothetical protein [Herbaspirillum]MDR6584219.1 hypothetical protein [Herbaspirillum frisingense]PLY59446.1 hypothetical protein HBH1_01956 [Herbaspirillum sp. BH-1]